jgi:hypothetical protein
MAKTPKKKPGRRPDFAENAFRVVQEAIGAAPKTPDPDVGKDPVAIARGKKGGAKGGKARAKRLSKTERSSIARKAAMTRWGKTDTADQPPT